MERFDTTSTRGDGAPLPDIQVSSAFRARWEDPSCDLFPKLTEDFPRFASALNTLGAPRLLEFKWNYKGVVFVAFECKGCKLQLTLSRLERRDWTEIPDFKPYSFAPPGLESLFESFEVYEFGDSEGYPLEPGRTDGVSPLPVHIPFAPDLLRWASAKGVSRITSLARKLGLGLSNPMVWLETRAGEALIVNNHDKKPLHVARAGREGFSIVPVDDARALVDSYLSRVVSDPFGMHGLSEP